MSAESLAPRTSLARARKWPEGRFGGPLAWRATPRAHGDDARDTAKRSLACATWM